MLKLIPLESRSGNAGKEKKSSSSSSTASSSPASSASGTSHSAPFKTQSGKSATLKVISHQLTSFAKDPEKASYSQMSSLIHGLQRSILWIQKERQRKIQQRQPKIRRKK